MKSTMKSFASFWSPSTDQSDTISISEASSTTHYTTATQQTSTSNRSNVQHTTWRRSQLQKQWIVNHPVFNSIQKNKTIAHYLSEYKLDKPLLFDRAKKDTEHQYISYTAQGLEHEMAIESIQHAPWTQYEMDYLISLVPRFTKCNKKNKKYIQWTDLQYAWVIRQMSEVRAKQDNRLTVCDASKLKAQWLTYTRTTKSPAIINPPAVVESLIDADVTTAAEIAETFDNDVSTSITQTENNTTLSKKKLWSVEEDQMFHQLYKERDGRWSYVEFCAVWPPELSSVYGTPTSKQWSNKNNTVKKNGVKKPRP